MKGGGVVVIDASLAAMWVLPETYTSRALDLVEDWGMRGIRMTAPGLILPEITNALHKRVVRRELDLPTVLKAMELILSFGFEIREEPGVPARALELASRLNRPSAYACYYLALAHKLECPFWTGDRRFYQAASVAFPQVRWIGEGTQ